MIIIGRIGKSQFSLRPYLLVIQENLPIQFSYTGKTTTAINLGSYNYLGFAEKTGTCANHAIKSIESYGVAACSTRTELGFFHF